MATYGDSGTAVPGDECTAPSNTEEISKLHEMLAAVQRTNSDLEKSVASGRRAIQSMDTLLTDRGAGKVASPCPESGPSHAGETLVSAALDKTLDAVVHTAADEALGSALGAAPDKQYPKGQGGCEALHAEEHTTEALLAMLVGQRRHRDDLLRRVNDK